MSPLSSEGPDGTSLATETLTLIDLEIPVDLYASLYDKGLDYGFVQIAEEIDGFGGMFIEEGSPVIYLTDPEAQEENLRQLLPSLYPEGSESYEDVVSGNYEIRSANNDFI